MKAGSMDALIGASANIKIAAVPFRVYREAESRGDTDVMERSLGYLNDFSKKAADYTVKAKEELAEELKEENEEQELKLEKIAEKRKEETKVQEEQLQEKTVHPEKHSDTDMVEISEEGKVFIEQNSQTTAVSPENPIMEIYTNEGKTVPLQQNPVLLDEKC